MDRRRQDRTAKSQARSAAVLVAMAGAALPGALHAQSAPTREELEIAEIARQPGVNASRLAVDGDVERGPCPFAESAFAAMRVNFSGVTFANAAGVPAEALAPAWRDMAGREVPIASLCEVRDRAATILRQMGYLAAVQVPPQRIEPGGEVRMDVLVAKLTELQVRGDAGPAERLIEAHLKPFAQGQWFNVREAERSLLLMSDLPGYDVRLTLRPSGKAPGEVIGDLLVDRTPVELYAGVQNLGSKATGREGAFVQLVLNGLTGLGDRTLLSLYNTLEFEEQTVVQAAHDFALGSDGLRLGGSVTYARGEPSLPGGGFRTETLIGRGELSYPFLLTRAMALRGAAGLELIDQEIHFAGVPLSRDKLRVLFGRLDVATIEAGSLVSRGGYTAAEPRWRLAGSLEARQGLSGLGASRDCSPVANCLPPRTPISDFNAHPSAFVVRLAGTAEVRPTPTITLAVSPRFQYSSARLLNFEQYSLGNYTIGRGFDPGIVLGDKGAGAAFEIRAGRLQPRSPEALALQPFAFLDAAWAWNNDGGVTNDPRRVLSAGGGVRARWGDRFDGALTLAAPLRRAGFQTRRGDIRVLFTLAARLVPWNP